MNRIILVLALFVMVFANISVAIELPQTLDRMLSEHPTLMAAKEEYLSTHQRKKAKFKDRWLPNLNLSYKYGKQKYHPAGGDTFNESAQEVNLRIEQRLFDFGESYAELAADTFSVKQKEANIEVLRQQLLMQALDAYLQVQKAQHLANYAAQSQNRIQEQTKLESTLVEKGKGYTSNVLQAKTQLAGAQAHLNNARADLDIAMTRVDAIFKDLTGELNFATEFDVSTITLPSTLQEALEKAQNNNPRMKVGEYRSQTLQKKIEYEKMKNFAPNLSLVGQLERNKDLDGHDGTDQDDRLMLELHLPLNLGASGLNNIAAAQHEVNASKSNEQFTFREIEKSVRIAWRNYHTASENISLLENKVNIAAEFLRLAHEERKAGRRSLLEILTAETTQINAQSELAAAKTDKTYSAFFVLYSIGDINQEAIEKAMQI